jgi:hypothetical protein
VKIPGQDVKTWSVRTTLFAFADAKKKKKERKEIPLTRKLVSNSVNLMFVFQYAKQIFPNPAGRHCCETISWDHITSRMM